MNKHIDVSVVCPVYNEDIGILGFCDDLRTHLDSLELNYEVLLVNDGSTDDSLQRILQISWAECTVISLARNVGHQLALEAGVSQAVGDYIITLDADGQHPVELIHRMYETAVRGDLDVVYMIRANRDGDSVLKRTPAISYYKLMRWLTNVPIQDRQADFRLVSKRVIEEVNLVNGEKILRLLLPSIGFRSQTLEYELKPRNSGKSRFGFSRQIKLATSSALNFSSKPLRLVTAMGWALSLLSFIWLIAVLVTWIAQGAIAGWTSVMTAVLLVGGMSLLAMSIIGAYIARIYDIVKRHPTYFIDQKIQLDQTEI